GPRLVRVRAGPRGDAEVGERAARCRKAVLATGGAGRARDQHHAAGLRRAGQGRDRRVRRGRRRSTGLEMAPRHGCGGARPLRRATQLALLDNLSDGRLDVGVGHGTNFNEYEFVGYGLRSHDSRERMDETLDVLIRAWTEAPLVHHGKFYDLSLPALRPRPRQRPHPPIWRAVSSAGSVRECGRIGAPILIARIPIARVPERLALYDAGLAESGL